MLFNVDYNALCQEYSGLHVIYHGIFNEPILVAYLPSYNSIGSRLRMLIKNVIIYCIDQDKTTINIVAVKRRNYVVSDVPRIFSKALLVDESLVLPASLDSFYINDKQTIFNMVLSHD